MLSQLLSEGLEHYLNGRLRDAAVAWEEVLRLDPGNRRAREYLKSALNSHGPLRPGRELSSGEVTGPIDVSGGTAWDDGPSASGAITLDVGAAAPIEETAQRLLADDDSKLDDAAARQVETLMRGARELYALNDFSGALELLEKVQELDPRRADAERMRDDCTETLTTMFESQLGDLSGVPVIAVKPDEIIWLNLDHRAGFVLSQIDGVVSYDDLYAICGMSRIDTARILAQLVQEKLVRTMR